MPRVFWRGLCPGAALQIHPSNFARLLCPLITEDVLVCNTKSQLGPDSGVA
jgi:hypothetical protein